MKPADIAECSFDLIYLTLVLLIGYTMWTRRGIQEYTYFAVMCLLLGGGDSFHLLPRVYSKMVGVNDTVLAAIGIGNLISSITMSVFYLLFLEVISVRYNRPLTKTRYWMYGLLAARIIALMLPQNDWLHHTHNLAMAWIRNIPFMAMGCIIVWLLFDVVRGHPEDGFRYMWIYVTGSFGCYIPVALCNLDLVYQIVLMIVKTIMYVLIVLTGFKTLPWKDEKRDSTVCSTYLSCSPMVV